MALRRNRQTNTTDGPGQDSFLDIVANLVGILVILVVIVGAHAGSRLQTAAATPAEAADLAPLRKKLKLASAEFVSMKRDNDSLEAQILVEQGLTAQRRHERDQLLINVSEAKSQWESQKELLSAEHRRRLNAEMARDDRKQKLLKLQRALASLESAPARKEIIEHYPTPIARTVFSDEVHFRLLAGQLVYVPIDELVDLMRNEWQEKAKKLDSAQQTVETVGPIENFRLQYELQAAQIAQSTPVGTQLKRVPEFKRFVLVPLGDNIGVSLESALRDGSKFQQRIKRLDPGKTTISVWVYPDSFEEFNHLKKTLYSLGFQTACWPLSENNLISGGPNGYRSTAQ